MKSKINLAMAPDEITEDELRQFKNFDQLLQKQQQIQLRKKSLWKIVVPATLTVLLVAYLFMERQTKMTEASTKDSISMSKNEAEKLQNITANDLGENLENSVVREKPNEKNSAKTLKSVDGDTVLPINSETEKQTVNKGIIASEPHVLKTEPLYEQAEPIGGYEKLYSYFEAELLYPQEALGDSIQGILTVTFFINKQGLPEQITTSGLSGKAFEEEAIRLLKSMPLWKPATLDGQPVMSKLTIPLTFQLQKK